jgi:hypothetical protein
MTIGLRVEDVTERCRERNELLLEMDLRAAVLCVKIFARLGRIQIGSATPLSLHHLLHPPLPCALLSTADGKETEYASNFVYKSSKDYMHGFAEAAGCKAEHWSIGQHH